MRTAIVLAAALLSGCTSQQLQDNQRGWREAECDKILDTPRRERCMREADQPYDQQRKPQ